MQRLMLTLETPAANLALDEALLDWAEAEGPNAEVLRLWESPRPIVVLGRSSRVDLEVDAAACAEHGIPILRRTSGGAAIVAGPGCLMYAVVLSYDRRPQARGIHPSHAYVLDRLAAALRLQVPTVERAGTSDLVMVDQRVSGTFFRRGNRNEENDAGKKVPDTFTIRKFSGNSLRVKRTHFLYHGTLLYDFDLPLITACLRPPPRQPAYRMSRDHAEFIANLPLSRRAIENSILAAWPASKDLVDWPRARVEQLAAGRYGQDEWNFAFGQGEK